MAEQTVDKDAYELGKYTCATGEELEGGLLYIQRRKLVEPTEDAFAEERLVLVEGIANLSICYMVTLVDHNGQEPPEPGEVDNEGLIFKAVVNPKTEIGYLFGGFPEPEDGRRLSLEELMVKNTKKKKKDIVESVLRQAGMRE